MPITKATASSIAPAAKGDLVVGSATNDASVLAVGTNDQVLTADSSTSTGLKWAAPAASNGPSFSAESNTEQNINASTDTKATFQVENWDTDSAFASSRFTPQKAGYYQVNGFISYVANASTTSRAQIFKNGTLYLPGYTSLGPSLSNPSILISALVNMNGTTDYIELYGYNDGASGTRQFYRSYFNAVWIRSL